MSTSLKLANVGSSYIANDQRRFRTYTWCFRGLAEEQPRQATTTRSILTHCSCDELPGERMKLRHLGPHLKCISSQRSSRQINNHTITLYRSMTTPRTFIHVSPSKMSGPPPEILARTQEWEAKLKGKDVTTEQVPLVPSLLNVQA